MANLQPFCAVRPAKEYASSIAALPYDVYDRTQAKAVVDRNPLSFLKIDRAETQFPDETDMYAPAVYEQAKKTLEKMLADGFFVREDKACYYIYSLTMSGHTQNGLVGCASIDDYLRGCIRRHENTLPAKELDRIRHIDTLNAHTGPIFLAYRAHAGLRERIAAQKQQPVLYDFVSEDGIRHQVWKISDDAEIARITQLFAEMETLYIADGHHRAASAVKVGLNRRKMFPLYDGTEDFNYFLSVLFPADELQIFPYNRIVTKTAETPFPDNGRPFQGSPSCGTSCGYTCPEVLNKLKESFELTVCPDGFCSPRKKGEMMMHLDGTWYRLNTKPALFCGDPVSDLDVSVLQDNIIEPLFGIHDVKTDPRISFIGGAYTTEEWKKLAEQQPDKVMFFLYPTSMKEVLAAADAQQLMPPKSTWFEPKLRSGLFIHEL